MAVDDSIWVTLATAGALFCVLIVAFDRIRTRIWWVYEPKTRHPGYQTPSPPGNGLFAFVGSVAKVWIGPELLEYGGVDAYVLVMFLDYAWDQCLVASGLGLVVLLPIYYTSSWLKRADGADQEFDRISFSLTTALNLHCRLTGHHDGATGLGEATSVPLYPKCANHTEWKFAVLVVVAWILTLRSLTKLSIMCCDFVKLRQGYLRKRSCAAAGDKQVQESLSVVIERVPPHLQTNKALHNYLNMLCDGGVDSVRIVAADLGPLAALYDRRESALESAIEARSMRVAEIRRLCLVHENQSKTSARHRNTTRSKMRRSNRIPGVDVAEATRLKEDAVAADEAATGAELRHLLLLRDNELLAVAHDDESSSNAAAWCRCLRYSKRQKVEKQNKTLEEVLSLAAPRVLRATGIRYWLIKLGLVRGDDDYVEAVPYYEKLVDVLGEEIARQHILRAAASLSETSTASSREKETKAGGDDDDPVSSSEKCNEVTAEAREVDLEEPSSVVPTDGTQWYGLFWALRVHRPSILYDAIDDDDPCFFDEKGDDEIEDDIVIENKQNPMIVLATKPLNVAVPTLWKKLKTSMRYYGFVALPRGMRAVGRGIRGLFVDYCLCGYGNIKRKALPVDARGFRASSTAYVTFSRSTARLLVIDQTLSGDPFGMLVQPAPESRDVIWNNVHEPHGAISRRKIVVSGIVAVLILFWFFVVTLTSNAEKLAEFIPDTRLQRWVASLLPVVLLLSIINLLPVVFQSLARFYERRKCISHIDLSVVQRFYPFQAVNVYVSIFATALLAQLEEAWVNPYKFIVKIGQETPAAALFLAKFLALTAGTSPLWLIRAWPLISRGYKHWTIRAPEVPGVLYGWALPKLLMNFTIVCNFWIFSPLTSVIGLIYFSLVSVFFRYLILYVHMPCYESGGRYFYLVVDRTLLGIGISNCILSFWFLTKSLVGFAILVAPLPVVVYVFRLFAIEAYYTPTYTPSLESARLFEKHQESRADQFDRTLYMQPVLRRRPRLRRRSPASLGAVNDDLVVSILQPHPSVRQDNSASATQAAYADARPTLLAGDNRSSLDVLQERVANLPEAKRALIESVNRAYLGEIDFSHAAQDPAHQNHSPAHRAGGAAGAAAASSAAATAVPSRMPSSVLTEQSSRLCDDRGAIGFLEHTL